MLKLDFNGGWAYRRLNKNEDWKQVDLPHDAMISEERDENSAGGVNTGWFNCHDYEYIKKFTLPAEYADKCVTIEFEGVYRNAEVYINGKKAAYRPYGYTNFYVCADGLLNYCAENEILVLARNADQPNSRWYSGAGIYRPVNLYVSPKRHILINGLKLRTVRLDPATVQAEVCASCDGEVKLEICFDGKSVACASANVQGGRATLEMVIENAKLWSCESPYLYECRAVFGDDERVEKFGIRTIGCNAKQGFLLNGERVILRGACIHHDNGILGARCFPEAEERKIALLKDSGYNAVRSAHNPCSKALLEACDRLGVMVVDEYCDMWYIHKTRYDYAGYLPQWYGQDLRDMIDKDFNHPCVIMYSLGNEVAETAHKRGVEFMKEMLAFCKSVDSDRTVTCGVNIFFNLLHSLGMGVYSDKKAQKNPQKKVGSAFFNNLAGIFGDKFMKNMAKLKGCDLKTRDCFAALDVAGYNYGILRYKKDVKNYPDRVILGSETFCSDAYAFWEFAKRHNSVIGDFVWAGMDYLGEAGIGSWEYREYAPRFDHGAGWISAGSGRLDLIGNRLGEALYTKVAFELTSLPQIAVVPVSHTGEKHSPSTWKFSNAIPSWSWNGLNGKRACVEVYSRAPVVELLINGKRVGVKRAGKNCRFKFKVKYKDGEIIAINRDRQGNELARNSLKTAGRECVLSVLPEKQQVKRGAICFVKLKYTDIGGTVKPLERGKIKVEVKGGKLLGLGNACPFNAAGYCGDTTDTYYGEAMAVVRADEERVEITACDGKRRGQNVIIAT